MERKTIYQTVMWHSSTDDLGEIIWGDEVNSYWESLEDAYKHALELQREYTYLETYDGIQKEVQTYFSVNKIIINPYKIN